MTSVAPDRVTARSTERADCVAFIGRLRTRLSKDTGFAAELRRSAGMPLAESHMVADWYGFLERAPARFRDAYRADTEVAFLIATLFAFDRKAYRSAERSDAAAATSTDTDASGPEAVAAQETGATSEQVDDVTAASSPGRRSFGAALSRLVRASRAEEDPIARRLAILLDSTLAPDGGGTLPWRLRRIVRHVLSKNDPQARIDWPLLLQHLLHWNDPQRWVQREWARGFYRTAVPSTEDAEAAKSSAADALDIS